VALGGEAPPQWSAETPEVYEDTPAPIIREQYAHARDAVVDRLPG
jgi:xylulokinase